MISKLIDKIYGRTPDAAPELQEYLSSVGSQHTDAVHDAIFGPASVFFLLASALSYGVAPDSIRTILVITYLILAALLFGFDTLRRMNRKLTVRLLAVAYGLFCEVSHVGSALALYQFIVLDGRTSFAIMMGGLYLSVGVITIVTSTVYGWLTLLLAIQHGLLGVIAFAPDRPFHEWVTWAIIIGMVDSVAFAVQVMLYRRSLGRGIAEWQKQNLAVQHEHLKIASIEKELALARQIQDSLSPQWTNLETEFATVEVYQKRYGILGGDWLGVRTLGSDAIVLAIADVTGKGIAAAMVAQAIHTLWAESLSKTDFEPEQWIANVNRTLLTMGHSEPHTATLGVLVVKPNTIQYYSCGHVPAVIAKKPLEQGKRYDVILARGNIVGIDSNIQMHPGVVDIKTAHVDWVMLGTDGVFMHGGRIKQQDMQTFETSLTANGTASFDAIPSQDDQLLIWVKLKNQAA